MAEYCTKVGLVLVTTTNHYGAEWSTELQGGPYTFTVVEYCKGITKPSIGEALHDKWVTAVRGELERLDAMPEAYLFESPSGPSYPTKWHLYPDCGVLAGCSSGPYPPYETHKILGMMGVRMDWDSLCKRCSKRRDKEKP